MPYTIVEPPEIPTEGKFTIVEPPKEHGELYRRGQIAAKGYASGVSGSIGELEAYLAHLPAELGVKGFEKLTGKEVSPETKKGIIGKQIIPTAGDIYQHLQGEIPKDILDRYIHAVSTGAGIGTVYGSPGGPIGAGVGAAGGGVVGGIMQTLKEIGVPDEAIQLLGYLGHAVLQTKPTKPLGKLTPEWKPPGAPPEPPSFGHQDIPVEPGIGDILLKKLRKPAEPPPPPPEPPPQFKFEPSEISPSLEGEFGALEQTKPLSEQILGKKQKPSETDLKGRVSKIEGMEDTPRPSDIKIKALRDKIGDVFSNQKFRNTTQGGRAVSSEIRKLDQSNYEQVNRNYELSRKYNRKIEAEHPQLVGEMQHRLKELNEIPSLSAPEKQLRTSLKNLIKRLERTEGGEVVGFRPINNQVLINQVQSLRKIIDHNFAHGDPKNIFRPIIREVQASAERAAAKNPKALASLKTAQASYREWATKFDNDYIRPLRDQSNRDYSKMYKSFLDLDEFNFLKDVLDESPRGKVYNKALTREIAQKRLKKFSENVERGKLNKSELDAELRELESFATSEQINKVKNAIASEGLEARKLAGKKTIKKLERPELKYKTAAETRKMFSSPEGVRKARPNFKEAGQIELFNKVAEQHVEDMLRAGKVTGKRLSSGELQKILEKRPNYEVLSEMVGEETVQKWIKEAERSQAETDFEVKIAEHEKNETKRKAKINEIEEKRKSNLRKKLKTATKYGAGVTIGSSLAGKIMRLLFKFI